MSWGKAGCSDVERRWIVVCWNSEGLFVREDPEVRLGEEERGHSPQSPAVQGLLLRLMGSLTGCRRRGGLSSGMEQSLPSRPVEGERVLPGLVHACAFAVRIGDARIGDAYNYANCRRDWEGVNRRSGLC